MVEYTIQYNLHASFVYFLHKRCEQSVGSFQILKAAHSLPVFCRMAVVLIVALQAVSTVRQDHSKMRVDVIIILNVIFIRITSYNVCYTKLLR